MSRHAEKKRCSACGAEFQCLAHCGGNTCWCNELPHIPMPTDAAADCLCPACLRTRVEQLGKSGLTGQEAK
ncbi:MAG: cysteine-rich CWC family protein [Limisphaerales bacterium]